MPVFDFNHTPEKETVPECTYTTFLSSQSEASPEMPILILDNHKKQWKHHSCGVFTNPIHRTSFEFKEETGVVSADILKIDARFVSLIKWLGKIASMYVFQEKTNQKDTVFTVFVRLLLEAEKTFCRGRLPSVYD